MYGETGQLCDGPFVETLSRYSFRAVDEKRWIEEGTDVESKSEDETVEYRQESKERVHFPCDSYSSSDE